jgi:regulator of sigma E protease
MKILQLFLSLTILITLHEWGHFFFAKTFKCRVEKFYLFFDFLFPFAGLLNFSLFKKKIGDTEYGIGWFPFGGYVSIAGMVDEQMDKEMTKTEPQPWELRAKPAWQRLLIMMGGILVNLVLGVFIYWMVLFYWGKETLPTQNVTYGIMCDSSAIDIGLKDGDKILSVDNVPVTSLHRVAVDIVMNVAKSVQVERDGKIISIPISEDQISVLLKQLKSSFFVDARFPTVVDSLIGGSPAAKAGLKQGDKLVAINGANTVYFNDFVRELRKNKDKAVDVTLLRGADTVHQNIHVTPEGTIGFVYVKKDQFVKTVKTEYGLGSSFTAGIKEGYEKLVMQVKQLVVIFTVKDAHKQVGGFYTMYQTLPEEWDWQYFWIRTAFFSLVLAFMNFLPIPMLDGGYIMFILFEMITRVKVPDKVIYYANYVGLVVILGLMIYANTDFLRK